jgi:hypothetical protein
MIHHGPTVVLLGVGAYILDGQCAATPYRQIFEPIGFKFGGTGVRSKSFGYLRRQAMAFPTQIAREYRLRAAIWHSVCFFTALVGEKAIKTPAENELETK